MPKQGRVARDTSESPLQDEFTNMSRQDTVCKFCGVSYLVHSEIKALEAKCQKLESELASQTRKPSQHDHTRLADLESTNAINNHKLNEMSRKLQLLQDQLAQSEKARKETKSSIAKYPSSLQAAHHQIQTIRKEYVLLQEFHSKDMQSWKAYLQTSENTLQNEMRNVVHRYEKQLDDYRTKSEQHQEQLRTQNDLNAAHQDEISRLHEQISQHEHTRIRLENELEQSTRYSRELERQLSDQSKARSNIDSIRDQNQREHDLRLKSEAEVKALRDTLRQVTVDYEQLNAMRSEFQTNELHTRRKIDEMNRARQAVLDRTRDEYEKLLHKYNDLDEVYHELISRREKDTSESKKNRSEVQRLQNENLELMKQKDTARITHDIQMKKLHDSYAAKLREMEQWPDRLQAEFKHEREQHRAQMNDLERRLKEGFVTELNIEKQKYNGLLRKYEHDCGSSANQLRQELISTEKVTIEQRHYYTKQIDQLEKDKENLQRELDSLRDVLKDLHEQLKKQESLSKDRLNHLKLKEDLVEKENSLFRAQSTINELKKDLTQTREEMRTLQETVHRECTEREQLKDALVDARQQLLTLKKNGLLNSTVSRSLHSPPVAFAEIEKRAAAPPLHSHRDLSLFTQSEPTAYNRSIPDEIVPTADATARPISAAQNIQNLYKALPPIQSQRQKQRRNKLIHGSNKSEQLLQNQRRIVRFIKQMK